MNNRKSLIVFCSLFLCSRIFSLDVPPLRNYVNDYAGLLRLETEKKLNSDLQEFETNDSTQIYVLTIPSLEGEVLEEYSLKVAEAWGIGQKGKDNGILFLVARTERKTRIEVGYGLEGVVTDLVSGRILDQAVAPYFRQGEYDAGVKCAVSALMEASKGEFRNESLKNLAKKKTDWKETCLVFFIVVGLITMVLKTFSRKLSVIVGGGAGFCFPFFLGSFHVGLILGSILLGMGAPYIMEFLLKFAFLFGGKGGFGGGSTGHGGFSGGGGGRFGGGGASGGW